MPFTGGYRFKHFEGAAEPVLRDAPIPESVFVARDDALAPCRPLVREGDAVRAGDPLIECGGGFPFPAPVSGTVAAADGNGVGLRSSGDLSFTPVPGHTRAPRHLDRDALFHTFRDSGCFLLFGGRFSEPGALDSIGRIIVNAVHNGPLDQGWKPAIFGEPGLFVDGLNTLVSLFPGSDITIAANRRNRAFFETPEITGLSVYRVVSDRYPQEFPELLARDIHGVIPGTTDPSVLVISFEDMIQTAECMTRGRPLIDRIVLVAGPGVSKPGWYRIRIGAPLAHLSRHLLKADEYGPWRIIRGGILTGTGVSSPDEAVRLSDREITVIREHASRDLYRFLNPGFEYDSYARVTMSTWLPLLRRRLDSSVHGGVRPCVQCNFCDEVCPVGIYPHLIWKQVAAGLVEETFRLKPHRCVACGLCDYVCPSKIGISRAVRSARAEYLKGKMS